MENVRNYRLSALFLAEYISHTVFLLQKTGEEVDTSAPVDLRGELDLREEVGTFRGPQKRCQVSAVALRNTQENLPGKLSNFIRTLSCRS